ncbi:glycosyltransferase [Robbsia sp. Bb-Pol-6]|uniref:Glycosyltransferase n=1 Tax=Robbsia betulipollinis TaxID=2981849 RepID=A0ABT3ZKA2_9BURK|nr:glycosyltransferase [Robbsia betulipollinis]MCY0386964.1 glycosyltransferase [Robbsia betulipollinis]
MIAASQSANIQPYHAIDTIHQIIIVDGMGMPHHLSSATQNATNALREKYASAAYTLWTGEMLREFIGRHYGNDVVTAFDSLKPHAYQCDLARYCLLHTLGGLYSDLGIEHYQKWNIPHNFDFAGCIAAVYPEPSAGIRCRECRFMVEAGGASALACNQ